VTGLAVGALVGAAVMVLGAASGGRAPTRQVWVRRLQWRRRAPGTDVVAAVSELAALVRAGLGPASAWEHVTRGLGDDEVAARLRAAASRVAGGLSPVPALRDGGAVAPDVDRALATLAASWAVHERSGAPVADLLDTLARSLRDADDAAMARRAALAAPVATARILAGLPVLGLALGQLVGARPLAVLVGTPAGRVSAGVGLVCVVVGVVWTRHLLRTAAGTR
jgi:tight adherence protein B